MKAVVMAGGEGSRLRPVTSNRPKPLVPIANQPIMEHILTLLRRHGITDIVSTLYYLGEEIQSHFGDGSDFGVSMRYSTEKTPLGTAGSVKQAEDFLKDDTFLIVSGDALTDCDLTAALEFHREKGSLATLILYRVKAPVEFGVVITDDDNRIVRFQEKPAWSEVFSDTVNTGMYILEPEILDLMEPGKPYDWSGDIFPKLLEAGKPMYGYVMDDYWADVGSLGQYREAQDHLLAGALDLPVLGEEVSTKVFVGANCTIDPEAKLVPPVCIGRNCKIKKGAQVGPYTVLGDNTLVEEGASVQRSVVWDSVYLGPGVSVLSAIVCSRATIKRDSVVREDAVIGDRCLIDVGCTIRPRIKLWPDKIVERGSTVTMSLIWANQWRGALFRDLGVAGLSNIEITPDFACRLGSAFGSCLPRRSQVVVSRDSTRSSRMIKRALMSALLGVGCDVLDLQGIALPIARHFIRTSNAAGAAHVRKLPGNSRVTLIEMMDGDGTYLSRNLERKIETAFFREDFNRTDPDDLGTIEPASRALDEYQADFFRLLPKVEAPGRQRIVCDYGFSSLATIYPAMMERLGVETISLNAFNDAKRAPRSPGEVEHHVQNVADIVRSLDYDMGVLFIEEGERFCLVDRQGRVVAANRLLGVMSTLVALTQPDSQVALTVAAPRRLESDLLRRGVHVARTKGDVRSLMAESSRLGAAFAGDDRGGFIFPEMHPGFDAPYSFAQMVRRLQIAGLTLDELSNELPDYTVAYEAVRVPWDKKGAVMRRMEEHSRAGEYDQLDGIKAFVEDGWVLVIPDATEPVVHVYAESDDLDDPARSRALVEEYVQAVGGWLASE